MSANASSFAHRVIADLQANSRARIATVNRWLGYHGWIRVYGSDRGQILKDSVAL